VPEAATVQEYILSGMLSSSTTVLPKYHNIKRGAAAAIINACVILQVPTESIKRGDNEQ